MAGERPRVLRTTKGIHCLLPRMTERAVYLSTQDDRMIFVIPWREFSLVGTTDRKSTRLNSSHIQKSRMPSSA